MEDIFVSVDYTGGVVWFVNGNLNVNGISASQTNTLGVLAAQKEA